MDPASSYSVSICTDIIDKVQAFSSCFSPHARSCIRCKLIFPQLNFRPLIVLVHNDSLRTGLAKKSHQLIDFPMRHTAIQSLRNLMGFT